MSSPSLPALPLGITGPLIQVFLPRLGAVTQDDAGPVPGGTFLMGQLVLASAPVPMVPEVEQACPEKVRVQVGPSVTLLQPGSFYQGVLFLYQTGPVVALSPSQLLSLEGGSVLAAARYCLPKRETEAGIPWPEEEEEVRSCALISMIQGVPAFLPLPTLLAAVGTQFPALATRGGFGVIFLAAEGEAEHWGLGPIPDQIPRSIFFPLGETSHVLSE